MTTVSEIAAQLGIDAKRARRILRKDESIAHEHGASWELDAKQAKAVTALLVEKTGVEPPKPVKVAKVAKAPTEKKPASPKKAKAETAPAAAA